MVTRGCLKSWFYTQNGVTMGLARVGGMCTKQHNCVIGNLSSIKNHRLQHQQHYQHHHQHHHQESLEWPIDRASLIHLLASQLSMSWLTRFAELCELIIFIDHNDHLTNMIDLTSLIIIANMIDNLRWSSLPLRYWWCKRLVTTWECTTTARPVALRMGSSCHQAEALKVCR